MHGYVVGWQRAVLVLITLGWLAAPLVVRPVTVIGLCAFGAFAALLVFIVMDTNSWWADGKGHAPSLRHGVLAAGALVAAVVAVEALAALGWLLLLAVVLSSPQVVSRVVDLRESATVAHDEVAPPPHRVDQSLAAMSTPDLVHAWRASFTLLTNAHTTAARAVLVARRGEYLEELERRDPDGIRRWLASGARAASDPSRFFSKRAA